jgi:hypothetical protein
LTNNYKDILSGNTQENCTTTDFDVKQYGGHGYTYGRAIFISKLKCKVYAIDTCSLGTYKKELTDGKVACMDSIVASYMQKSPLNSIHLYYHFNRRPSKYYPDGKFQDFVEKYQNNPIVSTIILSTFTGFFFVAFITSILFLYLRKKNGCYCDCTSDPEDISATIPATPSTPSQIKATVAYDSSSSEYEEASEEDSSGVDGATVAAVAVAAVGLAVFTEPRINVNITNINFDDSSS